jgi:predicted DNA-binding ribbon-helix-helix protein
MFDEKKTALVSRNITVNKRRTSIRLEAQMWVALKEIAAREKCTVHDICTVIGSKKAENITLTAAIRIFLMLYFKSAATEEGHKRAGHGAFHRMLSRAANTVVPSYRDDQISAIAH